MAHIQQRYSNDSSNEDNFDYPEPNYPYLYARSDAGYTTPAIAQAPLPPPSAAPSHRSSAFTASRRVPERAYSDTSRTSGDSYITPSLSASQVGNRPRQATYPRSHASQTRSQVASFVSRDDLRHVSSRPPTGYSPSMSSRAPTIVTSPQRSHTVFTAGSSSGKPMIRRLRSVLKKTRPVDSASYTDSSSAPEIINDSPTLMSPPQEPFPMPPHMDAPSDVLGNRRSMAASAMSPSVVIQKTRFHGSNANVSRHLGKPWDVRSPPRLDSATSSAPAFDIRGVTSIQLIVGGLPWSVHVRAGASRTRSRSRSRSRADQITVGDVVNSVYAALNKSLTRTDVRAASNDTKKRIARAAAAAERDSQRGEHSARTGKPSAARRIDYLGSRVWFLGLEKNDDFARQEGYGVTEHELKKVWIMRFSSSPSNRSVTI